jgi:uncharacterized protein YndB with AHSA1/START domain
MQSTTQPTSGSFSLEESTNTIRFERDLAAPPDEVFEAWTEPRQIGSWWDPTGKPLAQCDIDLRVGGAFTFVAQGREDLAFTGTYCEIERPEKLTFDALGARGRVLLSKSSAGTHMVVEIICSSPEHLRHFVQMGVAAGTDQTLDNLVAYRNSKLERRTGVMRNRSPQVRSAQ